MLEKRGSVREADMCQMAEMHLSYRFSGLSDSKRMLIHFEHQRYGVLIHSAIKSSGYCLICTMRIVRIEHIGGGEDSVEHYDHQIYRWAANARNSIPKIDTGNQSLHTRTQPRSPTPGLG